ncbi:hypothetical protein AYI70_g1501 [Smittium culicis]|uniref:Beta/gamma crystallin 'Greek key' domain-containing protein n=1 Tax=Smittium culicis TaxID=133412 RepID=A0A1R1YCP2_9FUNG|nr:hypothetical protein AYI70_g1501 [Smittium culicis]
MYKFSVGTIFATLFLAMSALSEIPEGEVPYDDAPITYVKAQTYLSPNLTGYYKFELLNPSDCAVSASFESLSFDKKVEGKLVVYSEANCEGESYEFDAGTTEFTHIYDTTGFTVNSVKYIE